MSRCDARTNVLMPTFAHWSDDEFEHVGFLGAFAGALDRDLGAAAIGQHADAVLVAGGKARLVQQFVGQVDVILAPGIAVLVLVQRALRHDGIRRRRGEAEIDDLVDLVAVDRHRKRATEANVAHQAAPDRINGVEVGKQRDLRALAGRPQIGVEAVRLFGLLEEGEVVEADEAGLQVAFAGAGLGRNDVRCDEVHQYLVDIGKLVALADRRGGNRDCVRTRTGPMAAR